MEREFREDKAPAVFRAAGKRRGGEPVFEKKPEFIIVDGYNLIFAWDELKSSPPTGSTWRAGGSWICCQTTAVFTKAKLVLVFDGFRTPGNPARARITTT